MANTTEWVNGGAPGISAERLNEPFHVAAASYDGVGGKIDVTIGPGRASFLGTLVVKTVNSTYSITSPAVSTTYYIYLKSDGTFTHNTTGAELAGAVRLGRVTTGALLTDPITRTDDRGLLPGAAARVAQDNLDAHKTAAVLDHPDSSVTDAKIGNRTPDQTQVPANPGTGTLGQVLSWLANRIVAITGATNWWDAPAVTISSIWDKFNGSTGHKHTGAAGDAPVLPAASITQGAGSGLDADKLDGLHASAFTSVLSGGTKAQSGYVSGSATVTFPTAFATLVAIVCVAKNGVAVSTSVYNESVTGFTYAYSSSPTGLYWLAIGT